MDHWKLQKGNQKNWATQQALYAYADSPLSVSTGATTGTKPIALYDGTEEGRLEAVVLVYKGCREVLNV